MTLLVQTQTLYQNSLTTPLGQIKLAGFLNKDQNRIFENRRVFGSYALVYVLEGSGVYSDANGYRHKVAAGDLLLLFPELAHTYGPKRGDSWSELFIVFDGPVFDFWREIGAMDSARPVHHLEPIPLWTERFQTLLAGEERASETAARAMDVCRFLTLLTEILAGNWLAGGGKDALPWLGQACNLLESYLGDPLEPKDAAARLGLSYETFRKRFQEAMGVAPGRYRMQKRIEAAVSLLQHTQLTNKEIAQSLGFSDPFHFAKRFKDVTGTTPRQVRRGAFPPSLARLPDKGIALSKP